MVVLARTDEARTDEPKTDDPSTEMPRIVEKPRRGGALERLIDRTIVERTKAKRATKSLGFIRFSYILFKEFKPFPWLASIDSNRQASVGNEKDRAPFHHPSIHSFRLGYPFKAILPCKAFAKADKTPAARAIQYSWVRAAVAGVSTAMLCPP